MKHCLKIFNLLSCVFFFSFISVGQVWINEIHYNNSGSDVNECVEIAGVSGTNLNCYSIVFYNGTDGSSYLTLTPSGVIDNEGCGYGALSFCVSTGQSIQNGNPDGIALYNTCTATLVQFLSYGGTFTASNGFASGSTSINIGQTEAGSIANSSLQLTGAGTQYSDFTWQDESDLIGPSFGSLNSGQNLCSPTNTITTGTISGAPFTVDYCTSTGSSGSVQYNTSGTWNVGNIFTVQLSNENGSFASPVTIGTLSSTSASGTISFTLPGNIPAGTGYRVRIVSSDPAVIGTNSNSFTISASCVPPYMTSLMINSCASAGCSEGDNEIIFGNTGDHSVLGTAANLQVSYQGDSYTQTFTSVAATTSAINTAANCAQPLLLDGLNQTMPAGSSFVIVRSTICPGALNWAQLCASGPIYVFYSTDASWISGGNFTNDNAPAANRTLVTSITTTGGQTFTVNYTFNTGNNSPSGGADGDYATWLPFGGTTNTHTNTGAACTLLPVFLDTDVISYDAKLVHKQVLCTWITSSEENNDYFTIEHSINGEDFSTVASIAGAGNSSSEIVYNLVHDRPSKGINYYKLTSTDYDGTTYNKGIVSVMVEAEGIYFDPITSMLLFGETGNYQVITTDGKRVATASDSESLSFEQKGLFLVRNLRTGTTERIFIP